MASDDALDPTLPASDPAPAPGATPTVGDVIDRYRLIARLGEGGMGVVYRAVDEDLGREVAVKLLRGGGGGAARLLDEARAMARLRDPSVVTVHDIGTAGGHDFIAMELVAGDTLAGWLRTRRPWHDVVRVMVRAARGLAAAHAAGVVHRDFKPSNVLIGDDGRVAVSDFGLAVDMRASQGGFAGTPAYMPPEQAFGEPVDARSDQFSLCLVLFEGLYGARPFPAENLEELFAAMRRPPVLPADPPPLPARLKRAVLRGLATDPAARHPDVPALIAELDAVLGAPRRRAMLAGSATVGVTIAAVVTWAALRGGSASAVDPCGGDPLGGTWPGARAAVTRGLEVEPTTRDATIAAMDRYAEKWRGRWRAACAAGPHDTPAFHEVAACLLDGREEAAALTAELARPSAALLADAVATVEALPDPAQCEPGRAAALPADPAERERARAIALELARVRGLVRSRASDAAAAAARALEDARALGHAPTVAAALYVLGAAQLAIPDVPAARATLTEATLAAEEVDDADLRARALIELATLEIKYSQDADAARRAARQASAAAEHARDPRLRPPLLEGLAELSLRDGDRAGAIARLTEAAALHDTAGALHEATRVRRRQAELMRTGGRRPDGLALLEAQLAVVEAELGRMDATTVALMIDTAMALTWLGRYDESRALVIDAAERRPPPPLPEGTQLITARVVDAAGAPVPDADVLIATWAFHGDGGYLIQATDPTWLAEQGVRTLRSDADGDLLAALDPGSYFVVAEHDAVGRSAPRWVEVTGDEQLTLTLVPWGAIEGKVSGTLPPDAHLHLIPRGGTTGYQLEVPIVDGAYRARAPAGDHVVQLIRSDDLLSDVKDVRHATLAPDAVTTLDLVSPPTTSLVVHVRGEQDVVVDSGAVFAIGGKLSPLPTRGDALLARFMAAGFLGASMGSVTTPEPGGCATTLDVPLGTYTVCAIGVQGDLLDPDVRERARRHAESYASRCQLLDLTGPLDLTITVPPPPKLAD